MECQGCTFINWNLCLCSDEQQYLSVEINYFTFCLQLWNFNSLFFCLKQNFWYRSTIFSESIRWLIPWYRWYMIPLRYIQKPLFMDAHSFCFNFSYLNHYLASHIHIPSSFWNWIPRIEHLESRNHRFCQLRSVLESGFITTSRYLRLWTRIIDHFVLSLHRSFILEPAFWILEAYTGFPVITGSNFNIWYF